jgi:hypothetical protein
MKTLTALGGGLAGAVAVTLIHESVKKIIPQAPRMDLLGMNAITKGLHAAHLKKPGDTRLFVIAMAADIFTNALYYSLAGMGKEKNIWVKSSMLGLAAGIGAVVLPRPLGLQEKRSNKTVTTQIITVGLYITGALITTSMMKLFEKKKTKKTNVWEQKLVTSAMG